MIFSLLIRNFKAFQNIKYIPISDSSLFSAFFGDNGVGKSTVLESLDSYFNNSDWNYNHSVLKKGFSEREPFICPIFLVEKSKINSQSNVYKYLEVISDITWQLEAHDFNIANRKIADFFCWHRDSALSSKDIDLDTHFLFPLGSKKYKNNQVDRDISIFQGVSDYEDRLKDECDAEFFDVFENLYTYFIDFYKFIYLPADIDFKEYTKIEGDTVQSLMGQKIEEIVKGFIGESQVKELNSKLEEFVKDVSSDLESYSYRKYGKRQSKVNLTHLSSKVIEAYFDNKVLNLKDSSGNLTPVYNLSSGEKRKAIIDVARAFLLKSKLKKSSQVILAVDEPEISLHIAACFEQFKKIVDISEKGVQTLVTTHWYGFMPAISSGLAVYMPENRVRSCVIDLRCFRDDIKKIKEATNGRLPNNLELKGINDLIQSIISSITSSNKNWVICEGVSDKIYLDHYLEGSAFVLPIGKCKDVKKIYQFLKLSLDEEKSSIKGKVVLLIDTDSDYETFQAKDSIKGILFRRLQNSVDKKRTYLEKLTVSNSYPPTEIEDVLEPKSFMKSVADILKNQPRQGFEEILSISVVDKDSPSGRAFNLTQSQSETMNRLFDVKGNKVKLALNYVENDDKSSTPEWIEELKEYLKSGKLPTSA